MVSVLTFPLQSPSQCTIVPEFESGSSRSYFIFMFIFIDLTQAAIFQGAARIHPLNIISKTTNTCSGVAEVSSMLLTIPLLVGVPDISSALFYLFDKRSLVSFALDKVVVYSRYSLALHSSFTLRVPREFMPPCFSHFLPLMMKSYNLAVIFRHSYARDGSLCFKCLFTISGPLRWRPEGVWEWV